MSGLGRILVDSAGGQILGPGASNVFCNNSKVCLVGDSVASHGLPPHSSANMTQGSATVFVNGKAVCRFGDSASCGHKLANGSTNVFVNS